MKNKPTVMEKEKTKIRVTQLDFWEPDLEVSAFLKWNVQETYNLELMGFGETDIEWQNISYDNLKKFNLFLSKIIKAIDDGLIEK